MGIGVQQSCTGRPGQQEALVEFAGAIAFGRRAVLDDGRQWTSVDPLGDQNVRGCSEHVRDGELGVTLERDREGALILRFAEVVEFLDGTVAEFLEERLDVQPRYP